MRKNIFIILISLFMASFGAIYVQAEIIPPENVDPGAVDTANKNSLVLKEKKIMPERDDSVIDTNSNKNSESAKALHSSKLFLKKISFMGNKVFKSSELEKLTSDIIGKEVYIDNVIELTDKITSMYREKGYITSLAYIAPQEIKDGYLEINVLEGKIGNIKIQGNKWARTTYLKNNILKSNDFDNQKIFNVNNLKKSLNIINNNDYLKGQVTLQKGEKPETTDIILNIHDRIPLGVNASWDNSGRDLIGIQKANLTLINHNLTGFGDSVYAGSCFASGTFGLNTGYNLPVGSKGTELRLGYSVSKVKLGGDYKQYNIRGRWLDFSASIFQPVYRKGDWTISTDSTFDMRQSNTTMQDYEYNNSSVKAFRAGINLNKEDYKGRWIYRLETSTGLPALGGTPKTEKGVGSNKFFKINTNLIRVQGLPFNSTGVIRIGTQFSPNTLLSSEQMQIGGAYSVRGFNEGLFLGDYGYTASLEIRTPIPFLPSKVTIPNLLIYKKSRTVPLKDRIQFITFYDQGLVKYSYKDLNQFSSFMQSVGVGFRCYLTKYLISNIDFGIPIGRDKTHYQKFGRVHFSLSSEIL